MIRSFIARTLTSALTLAAVVAFASNASATYQIRMTFPDGGPQGTLTNDNVPIATNGMNTAKDGDTATANRIDVIATGGGQWVYTFLGGRSLTFTTLNTTSNTPAQNSLSYNYSIVYNDGGSGAAANVIIEISRDDFVSPPAGLNTLTASAGGTFNSGSNGTMQVFQGMENGSNLYGQGTKQFDTGVVTNSPTTWSHNFSENVSSNSPYTLTSVIMLTFSNNNGSFSGNGTISLVNNVPVPAGLVLALTGLPAFGLIARRRRAVQA